MEMGDEQMELGRAPYRTVSKCTVPYRPGRCHKIRECPMTTVRGEDTCRYIIT